MAQNDLAKKISEIMNISMADALEQVGAMDVEQMINAQSAVDAEDKSALESVLQELETEESEAPQNITQIKSEIERLGKQNLKNNETMDDVWPLIGSLSYNDWKLMWPAIDQDILISLLSEATDEEQDSVSGDDAKTIHDYAQEMLREHVVYQGQIVEVALPRGPNNTIGIRTSTGIQMVSKTQVTNINEHVLGMTAMPSLARMMELAGMPSAEPTLEDRIVVKGGAGSISKEMMPVKLKRYTQELSKKLEELQSILADDTVDYEAADMVCKHAQYILNNICNNVTSAKEQS